MSKEQELAPDLDSILNGNFDEEDYEIRKKKMISIMK